jgi:hypothetical protein
VHLGIDVDRGPMARVAEFLDLGFQVGDRLLEVEVVGIHAGECRRRAAERPTV